MFLEFLPLLGFCNLLGIHNKASIFKKKLLLGIDTNLLVINDNMVSWTNFDNLHYVTKFLI